VSHNAGFEQGRPMPWARPFSDQPIPLRQRCRPSQLSRIVKRSRGCATWPTVGWFRLSATAVQ
jgi:hypothetical protein